MKNLSLAAIAASALVMTAGVAMADGTPATYTPPPAAAAPESQAKWTGPYIAASVGYSVADAEFNHELNDERIKKVWNYDAWETYGDPKHFSSSEHHDLNADGATGTIAIGYDRELHSGLVVGVFADYTFGELDGDTTVSDAEYIRYDHGTKTKGHYEGYLKDASLEYDDIWAIGARLGLVRSGGGTLWYVSAGYTETDVEFKSDGWKEDENLDGYFLGVGVEQKLHSGLSLKLDYRFSDFGSEHFSKKDDLGNHTVCGTKSTKSCYDRFREEDVEIDTQIHSIRLGVAYRFDMDRAAHTPLK